jgi:hypothetical protein
MTSGDDTNDCGKKKASPEPTFAELLSIPVAVSIRIDRSSLRTDQACARATQVGGPYPKSNN